MNKRQRKKNLKKRLFTSKATITEDGTTITLKKKCTKLYGYTGKGAMFNAATSVFTYNS